MIIIGEKLNSSRKEVHQALLRRDGEFFIKVAKLQKEKGANFIDLNTASMIENESDLMIWTIELIQKEEDIAISIDSPNIDVLEKAINYHKGKAILNSITVDERKLERLVPVIKEKEPYVVVMLMDNKAPSTPEECLQKLEKFLEFIEKFGLKNDNFFFDALLRPIGVDWKNGILFINSIRLIKEKYPNLKLICGLSNVSFGLPSRKLINRTFLPLILQFNIDGIILDVLDEKLMSSLIVSNALLGRENGISQLLKAKREGKITD
ncbi:MAG: dihydropteroate synthase [Candidatus Aminicenantia bacterium]